MNELLKKYNVTADGIKIFREGLGKIPLTLAEIQTFLPKSSKIKVKKIIHKLVDKKLVLLINSDILPHYLFLPPFAAIIYAFSNFNAISEEEEGEIKNDGSPIEKFQDGILQDIELISQDLIELISNQTNDNQTTEILSEVEKNVKKFSQVLLADVNELIAKLKDKSIVNEIDIERVMRAITKKNEESEEVISNMFIQFRDIINEMDPTNIPSIVESFKTFIRKLGDSIDKRSTELIQNPNSLPLKNLDTFEKSLFNILTDYISKNQVPADKLLPLSSREKMKELIHLLIENTKETLTIIVPKIEDFIPLEELKLEYAEETVPELLSKKTSSALKKPVVPSKAKPSMNKEQKRELLEKIGATAKRVSDLKGYELSHDVANILALVSEINPESLIIDNVQGWLNRLLVIRKYLDQNTQYLILEDIEKWKIDYLKIKKVEKLEQTGEKEIEDNLDAEENIEAEMKSTGLKIKIISSEPHNNKHVKALKKKNIEYLTLKNNNVAAIVGDDIFLAFGICQKTKNESKYEVTGFTTSFKPLIELIQPNILKIIKEAKPTRELQINNGFNLIIENINDYSGKKISRKLKNLLDVAFEKNGISLNVLEFKLLVSKLELLPYPLEDDMKTYVIEELNKLNKEFSSLELMYPPEFRSPIIDEIPTKKIILPLESEDKEVEPLDPEKVNSLFDLFLEKIDDLKGVELGDQIDNFIEVILRLQGYSQILEWKKNLSKLDKILDDPLKEKIKFDFLNWRNGILGPNLVKEKTNTEEPVNNLPQKDYMSEITEEYISPGLTQSQFHSDDLNSSESEVVGKEIDPAMKMKEIFDEVETNFAELNGIDISKKIQNIVDIILETEGYSMELKEIKDWISKLRKIRKPLDDDIKEDFVLTFFKWKEKYSKTDQENLTIDFGSSIENSGENYEDNINTEEYSINEKINNLIQTLNTSTGSELSMGLQDISDIVLPSYGAVAANALRQWISKLRSLRDLLEEEVRQEFLEELENWKEKFS
ncbi:MAG: hypothetical protein KGD58_16625 [Candidatus Lokiarchaeota archaeon]|nr:hypothetical protein [Candidatus Lokiarchaeota archaeon]